MIRSRPLFVLIFRQCSSGKLQQESVSARPSRTIFAGRYVDRRGEGHPSCRRRFPPCRSRPAPPKQLRPRRQDARLSRAVGRSRLPHRGRR
jgi:hypothetical protein